ncbi:hypothetical protein BDZ97DRAFT_42319 [Flammula alnicola]|nr:hypothetical protein BDZ97DRAFT_42319 [Flammula alnicola]
MNRLLPPWLVQPQVQLARRQVLPSWLQQLALQCTTGAGSAAGSSTTTEEAGSSTTGSATTAGVAQAQVPQEPATPLPWQFLVHDGSDSGWCRLNSCLDLGFRNIDLGNDRFMGRRFLRHDGSLFNSRSCCFRHGFYWGSDFANGNWGDDLCLRGRRSCDTVVLRGVDRYNHDGYDGSKRRMRRLGRI